MEVGSGGGVGVGGRGSDLGELRGVRRGVLRGVRERGSGDLGERRAVSESGSGGELSHGGGVGERSCMGHGGGVGERRGMGGVGEGSGVGYGGGELGHWSGVSEGCSLCDGGDGLHGDRGGFLAHHGVESVDRVGGVVDDALGAVGFQEGVATLNDVSVADFLLALGVAGQTVVHVVGVAVLGMRVVVCVDGLGDGRVGQRSAGCDNAGVGDGHEGDKSDELEKRAKKLM